MAIKQFTFPNSGIYQLKVRQALLRRDDEESLEDFEELLQETSSSLRMDDPLYLDQLETEATDFLKKYLTEEVDGFAENLQNGVTSDALEIIGFDHIKKRRQELNVEFQKPLSEEEKRKNIRRHITMERANEACEMLNNISVIRSQAEYGSNRVIYGRVGQVISHSLALGRAYERFRVRIAEPKAWTGEKVLQSVRKGGVAARAAAAKKYAQIVAKFKASGMSQRRFVEQTGITHSTLKRALKQVGSSLSK
jgi:hypothetical protein